MSDQGEPRREKLSPYQAPKAEVLLRQAIEAVEAARPVPLSSDSRINKDDLLELLNETLGRLPDELRAARWLLKEREEFLAKTRRDRGRRASPRGPRDEGAGLCTRCTSA